MRQQLVGFGAQSLLLAAAAFAGLMPQARGDAMPPWLTERRIHGRNGLEPVENLGKGPLHAAAMAVARVESMDGIGFCTATRVGPDLFLTNQHCMDFRACDKIQFHLGFLRQAPLHDQVLFRCTEVLARSLTFDYVLYRGTFSGHLEDQPATKQNFDLKDLNLPFSAQEGSAAVKTLQVPDLGNAVDIRAHVVVEGISPQDLVILLIHPSGATVRLVDRRPGSGLDRVFESADGLEIFAHQPVEGTWSIKVTTAGGVTSGGLLKEFDLEIAAAPEGRPTTTTQGACQDDFPVAPLAMALPFTGEKLVAIGHPTSRPMEMDRSDECVIKNADVHLEELRRTVTHMCDTEGGSSGSPLFDRNTGRIVALHWGGNDDYNMAIPIQSIVEDLKAKLKADEYATLSVEEQSPDDAQIGTSGAASAQKSK